jgi:hypothetical protein
MFVMVGVANANLITIGTATYGGNNYNLIYDKDSPFGSIVWLDYSTSTATWWVLRDWAAVLDKNLTYNIDPAYNITWSGDWRLPSTVDGPFELSYDGTTSYGYNNTSSELGHLFYTELGNKGKYNTSGSLQTGSGLTKYGQFQNLLASWYWSGTVVVAGNPPYTHHAWAFGARDDLPGLQSIDQYEDSGYVRVLAVRSGQVTVPAQPVLSVSPVSRDVAKNAGTTTFSISNTGTGTMLWTTAVTSGSSWLSITSGASGTNSGTINCSFTANTGALVRTATIRVTETDATGSPQYAKVTQAGQESLTISGSVKTASGSICVSGVTITFSNGGGTTTTDASGDYSITIPYSYSGTATPFKTSSDGSIIIPTVYTSGMTNYTTNYVSDLNTIRITDMSGSIPSGGGIITIVARDVDGKLIPESGSAVALKLVNQGTTTIEGRDIQIRFPGGVPVTYEFSIGSSNVVVTNLTKSTDGTINIPTVFTIGPYGINYWGRTKLSN